MGKRVYGQMVDGWVMGEWVSKMREWVDEQMNGSEDGCPDGW